MKRCSMGENSMHEIREGFSEAGTDKQIPIFFNSPLESSHKIVTKSFMHLQLMTAIHQKVLIFSFP